MEVEYDRSFRICFRHHLFFGTCLLERSISRVYSFLILTANIVFEIMILGLLYNAYMDTTEDTPYFEDSDDILDDYDFKDFLLTIAACAIAQPITWLLLNLLITQYEPKKKVHILVGLLITFVMILIGLIVTPLLASFYCCEASGMWAFGIIFVVLVEILFFQTLNALFRFWLDVKV